MARHRNPDMHKPVMDNAPMHVAAHHAGRKEHHAKHEKHMDVPNAGKPSHGPQASSLPGHLEVIKDVSSGRGMAHGIPGIVSSTTQGPEVRQRLHMGIIESMMGRVVEAGPVSSVQGNDATAWNAGNGIHLPGSRFK
jgi:hypothetical protein